MTIFLNGEKREVAHATNIAELLDEFSLPARALLVEHNGTALHRDEWLSTKLAANDRIEILRVVAGG
jgi:sulfur carrier protein